MRLLFKQKLFSWFDSYDIFDEEENIVYKVKGQFSWGHCLKIFDKKGNEVGKVKQKVFAWYPRFDFYKNGEHIGFISRVFSPFKPKYHIDYNDWDVVGNWIEWDYDIINESGARIAGISKEIFKLTDTYVIDVANPKDALCALMIVLSIDAEKCSRK